jgi:hypothetical protein
MSLIRTISDDLVDVSWFVLICALVASPMVLIILTLLALFGFYG